MNEEWDGYPAGAIVLAPSSGVVMEIQGPAKRWMVKALVSKREYSSYAQKGRVLGAIHEKGWQLIKSIAEYNIVNGRDADDAVAQLGQFVFYTGEE